VGSAGFLPDKKNSMDERDSAIICLHAAPIRDGHMGGLEFSVPALVSAQHHLGGRVALLVTARHGRVTRDLPFPVFHAADFGWRHCLSALPKPFNRPHLVNLHSTYIPLHAWIAVCARKNRIPYVVTPRGGMSRLALAHKRSKKRLGNLLFFDRLIRHAAAVHCLTAGEQLQVLRWGRPTFVVPNGIDMPLTQDPVMLIDGFTREVQGTKQNVLFLFLGRISTKIKGLDLLLSGLAWARRSRDGQRARLWIVGPDPFRDKADLRNMAQRLGIADAVVFGVPVSGLEKRAIFRAADVFVHTSRTEACPTSVLEALSWGLPCLLTPGTNIADDVVAAGAGWRAEGTAESIGRAILKAISAEEDRRAMGQNARRLVERSYTWEIIARQTLVHYAEIVGSQSRPFHEDGSA